MNYSDKHARLTADELFPMKQYVLTYPPESARCTALSAIISTSDLLRQKQKSTDFTAIISEHGGVISHEKSTSRSLTIHALFYEDDDKNVPEYRAVTCAIALQDTLADDPKCELRIGIAKAVDSNSQPIYSDSLLYASIGNEQGIFIDSETESHIVFAFNKTRIESYISSLKRMVTYFRIIGVMNRYRGKIDKFEGKTIGKAEEFAQLYDRYREAATEHGNVVIITGEPGIGKSRLVASLLSEMRRLGGEPSIGHCYHSDQSLIYHPWRELLSVLFQIFDYQPAQSRRAIIDTKMIEATGEHPNDIAEAIYEIMGIPFIPESHQAQDNTVRAERVFEYIAFMISAECKKNPCVLIIEDAHWCDERSYSLLTYIAEVITEMRALLVITTRPDLDISKLKSIPWTTQINIEPLTDKEARELARSLLFLEKPETALEDFILNSSENNPFYIVSFVQGLFDQGLITIRQGKRKFTGNIDSLHIPSTMKDLILSRVEYLDAQMKRIICGAAVIGRSFSRELLRLTVPSSIPDDELTSALLTIEHSGIIHRAPQGDHYYFTHVSIRDVLYAELPEIEREALHMLIASHLEFSDKSNTTDIAERLCYHYSQGHENQKGSQYALVAGEKSLRHLAYSDALRYYTLALDMTNETVNEEAFNIKRQIAHILAIMGRYDQSEIIYRECLSLSSDPIDRANIHMGLGSVYQETGRPLNAIEELETAIRILKRRLPHSSIVFFISIYCEKFKSVLYSAVPYPSFLVSDSRRIYLERQAEILWILNKIYYLQSKRKLEWAARSLVTIAHRLRSSYHYSLANSDLAITLLGSGKRKNAMSILDLAGAYSVKSTQPITRAALLSRSALLSLYDGKNAVARNSFCESISLFRESGALWEYFFAMNWLAQTWLSEGEYIKAEETYKEIGDYAINVRNSLHAGWMYTMLSVCRYYSGKIDLGLATTMAEIGERISIAANDLMNLCRSYGHLSLLACHSHNHEEAAHYALLTLQTHMKLGVIIPHVRMTLLDACGAALFAASGFSGTKKRKYISIAKKTAQMLRSTSEIYSICLPAALIAKARINAFDGLVKSAELEYTHAIALLSRSGDPLLKGMAFHECGLLKGTDGSTNIKRAADIYSARGIIPFSLFAKKDLGLL